MKKLTKYDKYALQHNISYKAISGLCIPSIMSLASNRFDITVSTALLQTILLIKNMYEEKNGTTYLNPSELEGLEKPYNEILDTFNLLSNELDLNNVKSIYALYKYMLNNGLLSYPKKFKHLKPNGIKAERKYMLGANVIDGFGCCRNVSSMLTDIYRNKEIDGNNILVSQADISLKLKKVEENTKTKQELIDCISNMRQKNKEKYLKYIKKNYPKVNDIEIKYIWDMQKNNIFPAANHLLNIVNEDNITYIFDAYNDAIYYKINNYILTGTNNNVSAYMPKGATFFNVTEFNYDKVDSVDLEVKLYRQLEYLCEDIKEIEEELEKYNIIISNNKDILEEYYKDNKDRYEEVANIIDKKRIVKRKIFKY